MEANDLEDRLHNRQMKQDGWWATKAFAPVVPVSGPFLPACHTEDAALMKRRMTERCGPGSSAFRSLQGRQAVESTENNETSWWKQDKWTAVIMQSHQGLSQGDGQFANEGLSSLYAKLHIRCFAIVHFFSGYRRTNDLHQVIQQIALQADLHIFMISIDICMQRKAADLSEDGNVKFWIDRIKSGQLVAAGGGPPCETYTAARFQAGGPPPVRSGKHLCGLPALTPRAWAQVRIGTALVRFMCDILFWLGATGGCAFFEHPQWASWIAAKDPPSVWLTKQMRMLKTLECTSFVSFDQCVFQAPIRKPTTLCLIRLQKVRSQILAMGNSGRCNHAFKHEALKGKDETGTYRTAKGKIYPEKLNELLGREMVAFVNGRFSNFSTESLPEEMAVYCQDVFADDHIVQPDFCG